MKEQLYTIPVNDAFEADAECPLCKIYHDLEKDAIGFTMGSSYMQDDIRMKTNEVGFCPDHIQMMYANGNRLGLALMMNTHYDKIIADMKSMASKPTVKNGFFSKKEDTADPVVSYIKKLEKSCFVCERINSTYPRYVDTIFYLWKNDSSFHDRFIKCKGFCISHYAELYERSADMFGTRERAEFLEVLNRVFFDNIERVNEDISWFIEKFDYRNKDASWKNSKDALPRGITKLDHVFVEEPENK